MEPQGLEEALEVYMDESVAFNICERDITFYLDLDTMSTNFLDSFNLTDKFVIHKCDTGGFSRSFIMAVGME